MLQCRTPLYARVQWNVLVGRQAKAVINRLLVGMR